jgi:hypothetical protein
MAFAGGQPAICNTQDMLGNNINLPNDVRHWIYYRAFSAIGL